MDSRTLEMVLDKLRTLEKQVATLNRVSAINDVVVVPHTFAIGGTISVPSGDTDFIPPFFIAAPTGQTVRLVGLRTKLRSGTGCTVTVYVNGAAVTGYTGIGVTTTSTTGATGVVSVINGDEVRVQVASITGTPKNLSATLFLEYS